VRQTRAAAPAELVARATRYLDTMLALGTTTVEIKSGYGLDIASELKMLRVIETLAQTHPLDVVPTFLGAHTVPPEFAGDTAGYVELVVDEMVPAVAAWYAQSGFSAESTPLFIDVFCEDHAFDVAQTERILSAGAAVGMRPKIHVDQFHALGGVGVALRLGATSLDHLEVTAGDALRAIANSDAVAVLLPAVNFNLGLHTFAPARALIDAGAAVALATDFNPGSAPCLSLPLVMGIACRYLRLTPAEALAASTINGAYALGIGHLTGSLQIGKRADCLLLKTPDYRHLAYWLGGNPVKTVIKRGKVLMNAGVYAREA
jgi:imidazolonepropionase